MADLKIARPNIEKVDRTPVAFRNEESGLMLAGIIYRPRNRKEGAEQMYANANEPKELYVVKEAKHSDMYDVEPYVSENMEQITKFLGKYL